MEKQSKMIPFIQGMLFMLLIGTTIGNIILWDRVQKCIIMPESIQPIDIKSHK